MHLFTEHRRPWGHGRPASRTTLSGERSGTPAARQPEPGGTLSPRGPDHVDLHRLMAMAPPIAPGALAMATTNPTVTGAWTLIVAAGDEFLLTQPVASQTLYVAVGSEDDSDSDPQAPDPGIIGHPLAPGRDGINRALIGPGPVYARLADPLGTVKVALTAWTPA